MRFLTFFRSIGNSSVRVNLRTLGQPFAIPRDGLRDILLSPSSIEDKMHFPYCYSSSTTSAKDSAFPFLEYVFQEIIFTKYVVKYSSVFCKIYFLHTFSTDLQILSRKSMSL